MVGQEHRQRRPRGAKIILMAALATAAIVLVSGFALLILFAILGGAPS